MTNSKLPYNLLDTVDRCLKDGACKSACRRLQSFEKRTIADIAQAVLDGTSDEKIVDFLLKCSLCGLCNEICTSGVDIRGMVRDARNLSIEAGIIDPELYRHLWVDHDWNFFTLFRRTYGLDGAYKSLIKERCDVLFFPGCMLVNEGPELVRLAAEWLTGQGRNIGLSIQCCGAPLSEIGLKHRAQEYAVNLWQHIKQTGARRVITCCPTCHAKLKETAKENSIEVSSLFQLMAESNAGLPLSPVVTKKITIHDSCSDRGGCIGTHVRELLKNFNLVEMEHHGKHTICCGSGGLVSAIDPELCRERAERRLKEASEVGAETCVTYCMGCAHRLGGADTRDSIRHILELIFEVNIDHAGFDRKVQDMFQDEHAESNLDLLQNSKLATVGLNAKEIA